MKEKTKIIIGCLTTLCLTLVLLISVGRLLELKDSRIKHEDFFNQKEDFDVLFIGSSHVTNGVFPMELWNEYGIVSYNLGEPAAQIATTYWMLQNALEHTTPKVVVLDGLNIAGTYKGDRRSEFMHLAFDDLPFSKTKINTVEDILDDKEFKRDILTGKVQTEGEVRSKIGYLWNYSIYHSRWNELSKKDFVVEKNIEKGAESGMVVTQGSLDRISKKEIHKGEYVGEEYFRKIIEDCQNKGIEVLLTYLPSTANEFYQKESNMIYAIAEEYGVQYINFLDSNIVDYKTDMCDNSHLNVSGARKVTNYLGNYLVSNYDLEDHRTDEEYKQWREDAVVYEKFKTDTLKTEENLLTYLMLLSASDYDIIIEVDNTNIFKDKIILDMLKNLGVKSSEISELTTKIYIENSGEEVEIINSNDTKQSEQSITITVERDGVQIDKVKFEYQFNQEDTIGMVLANRY